MRQQQQDQQQDSRPGRARLASALVILLLLVPLPGLAQDTDGDGAPDANDNCPSWFNPGQEDQGGLRAAGPDGDGDGDVDMADAAQYARHFAGLPPGFLPASLLRCRTNADGVCDGADGDSIRAALAALAPIVPACGPATPGTVTLTAPAHGAFTLADPLPVQGVVTNADPTHALVTVNGIGAALQPDGTFSVDVPLDPAQVFQPVIADLVVPSTGFTSRDNRTVIFGDSIPDGDFSLASVALRINDTGFDQLEPQLETLVPLDLETLVPPGTVLIQDFCAVRGLFGLCLSRVDVTALAADVAGFSIDIDSRTDFVAGDVTLDDLFVNVNVRGNLGIINCNADVTAEATFIPGDYDLVPDTPDASEVDVNQIGNVSVSFSAFNFNFTSGICDFPLLGDLIQALIGDVEPTVRQGLEDFLNDPDGAGPLDGPIADAVETALDGIRIAGSIGEGLGILLEAPLFDIMMDPDGIVLDADTAATSIEPDPSAPDLLASYHVEEAFPSLGPTTPVGALPYDVGICISTSAFNQLLKAETEGGLLITSLDVIDIGFGPVPLNANLVRLLIPAFAKLDPFTPLVIDVRPTLAPVVTGAAGPGGELAELAVGGLEIAIVDAGAPITYLAVAVDLRTGFDLAFDAAVGGLAPTISEPPASEIGLSFLSNPLGANEATVSTSLPPIIGPLLPELSATLGAFPLPAFVGLDLAGVEVSRAGEFMSVFVDLVPPAP